jgi:hypothetical protein
MDGEVSRLHKAAMSQSHSLVVLSCGTRLWAVSHYIFDFMISDSRNPSERLVYPHFGLERVKRDTEAPSLPEGTEGSEVKQLYGPYLHPQGKEVMLQTSCTFSHRRASHVLSAQMRVFQQEKSCNPHHSSSRCQYLPLFHFTSRPDFR